MQGDACTLIYRYNWRLFFINTQKLRSGAVRDQRHFTTVIPFFFIP